MNHPALRHPLRLLLALAAIGTAGAVTLVGTACEDDAGGSAPPPAPDAAAAAASAPRDGAAGETAAAACPALPAELECDPPQAEPLPPAGARTRHCAFDIGSTNVKLVITSTVGGDRSSMEGERVCKKALRLRDRVQDAMGTPKALAAADMDQLVAQLQTYGKVCADDGGTMLGAVATQWARTATNAEEVKSWFMEKMGFPMNIITGDQEGAYGYAAATHDQLDRIILDAGGGSFQVTFWPGGEPKPTATSLRFGHEESAAKVWTRTDLTDYAAARQAYLDELRTLIAATPASAAAFGRLEELVASGKVGGELISLGDSGVILAVQGKLRDGAGRWVDQATYLQRLDERRRELAAATGVMGPRKTLEAAELDAFLDQLAANRSWFEELRSPCIRQAYGGKVLGHLTLVSYLIREYGLGSRVVFTSGEMGEGFILEKLK
jgi:exopolyphosphatase/pppGpp-phosphohydrolase